MAVVNFIDVKQIAPELGVYFIVSLMMYLLFMNKIRGKLHFIEVYIASRDWDFLESADKLEKYLAVLKFIMISLLMTPAVSLFMWAGALIYTEAKYGLKYETRVGISTFFLCAGFMLTITGVGNMKWEKYKITTDTVWMVCAGTLSYATFLFVVVFMQDSLDFIGLSAIFISANGILVFIVLFFTQFKGAATVEQVLAKLEPIDNIAHEIDEMYSLPKIKESNMSATLNGGIQMLYTNEAYAKKRKLIVLCIYIVSLGVLAAYSAISKEKSDYSSLGILTSMLILTVDLIVLIFIHAGILTSAFSSVLLSVVARFFLFILNQDNWFYGYSCVYWVFSLFSIKHVIDFYFPLLHSVPKNSSEQDIAKTVEFTYISVLGIYVSLILAISLGKPSAIPYTTLKIQEYELPLWLIGVCVVMISLVFAVLMVCFRLVKRRIHRVKDSIDYYFYFRGIGLFWVIGSVGVVLCWSSAITIYLAASSTVLIVTLSIFPLIVLINLNFYANWVKNDYSVVKNPHQFNEYIQKRRKQDEDVIEKVREYQEDYLDKLLTASDGKDIMLASGTASNFMKRPTNLASSPTNLVDSQKSNINDLSGTVKNTSNLAINSSDKANVPLLAKSATKKATNPRDALRNKLGFIDPDKLREKLPDLMYDWTTEMSVFTAFFKKKLLKNDYLNAIELFLSILLSCIMAGVIFGVDREMKYGVTCSVMVICLTFVLYPLQHNLFTSIPFSIWSYLSMSFGVLLNFGYGYIYYHFELKQHSSSSKNGINVFFNTFALPILICYIYAFIKLKANKWKINTYVITMLALAQVFSFSGSVIIIIVDTSAGIALFGFFFIIALFIGAFFKYSSDGFRLSGLLKFVLIVLTVLISLSGVAIGIAVNSLGVYAGFSITYLFLCSLLIIYSSFLIYQNLKNSSTAPVYFSAWVFPIYKYSPATASIVNADNMGLHLLIGIYLVFIWSITCIIWLTPSYIGVSVACLCEVLLVLIYIFLSIITSTQLDEALQLMNPDENLKTLKKAWVESKDRFLTKLGAANYEDFPSYFERYQKLSELFQMIKSKSFIVPESANPAWKKLHTGMKDLRDLLTEYYIEDTKNIDQYILELELVIHFELLVVLSAFSSRMTEILIHNNLAVSKSVELKAFGIFLTDSKVGKTLAEKYSHITHEVSKLNHVQRMHFEDIKEDFVRELEEQKIRLKQKAAEEAKAQQERMEAQKKLYEERKMKLQNQTSDLPIEEMVDSKEKYNKIIEDCKKTNKKFEDTQFLPNEKVLGFTAKGTTGWKRAENCQVYEGNVSALDIKQGAIGDCYFLSAICVLREERTKAAIVDFSMDYGVYLMKFYRYGDPVFVIVDDYFPVNFENNWAFAQTVTGKELWPMLLEKGYAKLNGGYQNIVAGKVHFALSDLTGGQPEEVKLEPMQNNPDALWSKLVTCRDSNYPMGAGSPENPQGDAAVSKTGIVQGHAYSVLDAQEVNGEKVVKLKNPHGQHGQEWNGDWSDGSSKWTKQAINQLKYEELEDGIFWMGLEDFIWEFKNLYICRIYDDPKWKKLEIEGEWAGKKAAGFPCKDNPHAVIGDNPQFLLKVSKNSVSFITLTQKNAVDMFKGKCPILFMVFSGDKRVSDISKGLVGSSGKPIDLRIVSNEIVLNKGNSYVILITDMYEGDRGKGGYELAVTVDDTKATLTEI